MVSGVRVLVLRSAGTNCDLETAYAWELAGAEPLRMHVRQLLAEPQRLHDFQILTLPGGFSYGDDIAAGRILAAQLRRSLLDELRGFIDAGRLVLGICNGFQVLVQAGVLPFAGRSAESRTCTIAGNNVPGYCDRWVYLRAEAQRCVFLEPGERMELPMAHGEGRVTFSSPADLKAVVGKGQNALVYCGPPAGQPDLHGPPANPNGSQGDIAGLCDETGRVLGLMPHPERFVAGTQHPCWTSRPSRSSGDGLGLFVRAVRYLR